MSNNKGAAISVAAPFFFPPWMEMRVGARCSSFDVSGGFTFDGPMIKVPVRPVGRMSGVQG